MSVGVENLRRALREEVRRPHRYLSKESSVSLVFSSGTPKDTEGYVEVSPPDGYFFAVRYFKLTTPPEVEGNILATGMDGVEVRLLAENQAENVSDQVYDASDWGSDLLYLKKFKLYGVVIADTTADRELILRWSGGLVRWER